MLNTPDLDNPDSRRTRTHNSRPYKGSVPEEHGHLVPPQPTHIQTRSRSISSCSAPAPSQAAGQLLDCASTFSSRANSSLGFQPHQKMESQETLINPTPLTLKFSKRSCTNVTIYRGVTPIYRVKTNKDSSRTDVFELEDGFTDNLEEPGRLLTTIKRREFLPDVVKFRNQSLSMKISKWLQKEKLPNNVTGMTLDTSCGPLLWRYGTSEKYRLALYTDKDAERPVAYLDCTRTRIPMVLVIEPGYVDLTEEILTSALVLEFKLKMFDRMQRHEILYGPILGGLVTVK